MSDFELRIVLVTTSIGLGGAETQVFLLARELRARGHAVHVVSMRDPEAYQPEMAELGIPFTSLGMRRGRPDPRALGALARVVRGARADVVHSHMVHANLLARLSRPLAWAPVQISTAHNLSEGGRVRDLAYRATDALATLTTNVCLDCVERFVAVGAVPRDKIRYMPNGLDVSALARDEDARRRLRDELGVGDRFLWLAVGRLDVQKDYPTMLRAVRRAQLDEDFMLAIVGGGPEEDRLRALRDELALGEERVRFLGLRDDVPGLMSAADGYLMSSAWEGLPMVLLEAASAQLPIVATDVGGNREVVHDGRSGVLVPPGDEAALADAMTRVSGLSHEQRCRWGRAARDHVDATYRIDRIAERWEALYRELLERRADAPAA